MGGSRNGDGDSGATACQPTTVDFAEAPPQLREADGAPTWIVRAANFVVAVTRVSKGTRLARNDQPDEYVVVTPPDLAARVNAGGHGDRAAVPDSLTILPPGSSEIVAVGDGYLYRIFSNRAEDVTALSSNASVYAHGVPAVRKLKPWPDPVGGFKIRSYPLTEERAGDALGRIYRCTNLMLNVLEPFSGPRNNSALTPHSHEDFEQGSLTLAGTYEHFLRTPWGPDRSRWEPDRIVRCGSPSLTVIPAGMIHTTVWHDKGGRMIDIFAAPRADFSARPGWVRNAEEYPTPEYTGARGD
jgi:hypothetical protein